MTFSMASLLPVATAVPPFGRTAVVRGHLSKTARTVLCALAACFASVLTSSLPAHSAPAWRPGLADQRFDLQLSTPFNLSRRADLVALELFGTGAERLERLRARGIATLCHLAAGLWENWRPDAPSFPTEALGRSPSGWQGQRWLDLRHQGLRPILEQRLDLCRQRGFKGVLFAKVTGGGAAAAATGFDIAPAQTLAFARWLAEAAHARGLAAGILGGLDQAAAAAELATSFDFLVDDACVAQGDCTASVRPFLAAGKPAYLVAFTNNARRMDAYCALAAEVGAPLIFKTEFLNGKLHRRCP